MDRSDEPNLPWSLERHAGLVDELLEVLGRMFDLEYEVAGSSLRATIRLRLERLADRQSPTWGMQGSMTEIARQKTGPLEFFYRPHLFPDMDDGLRLAHQLQFDLLPRSLPATSPISISALLESYCHLSGDLLGWRAEDDELLVWIADVSGHGVRAGLAAAVFYVLSADIEPGLSPTAATHRLSARMLEARNPQDDRALFATSFWARFGREGRMTFCSAGHPPMLRRRAGGGLEKLESTGPPIGMFEDAVFAQETRVLDPDDLLLLFTDGLIEATNAEGSELGLEWIERLLEKTSGAAGATTREVYRALSDCTDRSSMEDDLTLLALQL